MFGSEKLKPQKEPNKKKVNTTLIGTYSFIDTNMTQWFDAS